MNEAKLKQFNLEVTTRLLNEVQKNESAVFLVLAIKPNGLTFAAANPAISDLEIIERLSYLINEITQNAK